MKTSRIFNLSRHLVLAGLIFLHGSSLLSHNLSRKISQGKLVPKLILQLLKDQNPEEFRGIRDISIGPQGILWTFDYRDYFINKYSLEGKLLCNFGGTGEQPGKFRHLTGIKALEDGILAVDSTGLSKFSRSGEFLKKLDYQEEVLTDLPVIFEDGGFAGQQILSEEQKTVLTLRSREGRETRRLASYDLKEFFPELKAGEDFFLNNTYARNYLYTINPHNQLIWAASDSFTVFLHSSGESTAVFSENVTPVPFPPDIRENMLKQKAGLKPPLFLYVPENYPLIYHLACDREGDIWIYLKSREQTGFLCYSNRGELKGFYTIDADFDILGAQVRIFGPKMYFIVSQRNKVEVYAAELPKN